VAFNSEFVEGQTQTYRLEDTIEQAFRLLVQWLYSQKFELPLGEYKDNDQIIDPEVMRALMAEENSLAELWVLADKLCIPALQNLVIDTIHMICSVRDRVPVSTYRYIYEKLSLEAHSVDSLSLTRSGISIRRAYLGNLNFTHVKCYLICQHFYSACQRKPFLINPLTFLTTTYLSIVLHNRKPGRKGKLGSSSSYH